MINIMRGLPGSGKSTWVKNMRGEGSVVCSSDLFFISEDGSYRYDPKLVGEAHGKCLRDYTESLLNMFKEYDVFVDNTNTTLMELTPYIRLAEAYKLPYRIVYLMCSVEHSMEHNTHQVPPNTILKMNFNLFTEIVPVNWIQIILPQKEMFELIASRGD